MENKVYVVKSSFGRYDDSYTQIEGIFTDPLKAEELKLKIHSEIEALIALCADEPLTSDPMTEAESIAWNEWFNNSEKASDFILEKLVSFMNGCKEEKLKAL